MFKSRSAAASDAPETSIEVVRVRARQRLVGAAVLVGLGVIGFPLVFDTEPRRLPSDISLEITGKSAPSAVVVPATGSAAPAVAPAAAPARATSAAAQNAAQPSTQTAAQTSPSSPAGDGRSVPLGESLDSREEVVTTSAAKPAAGKPAASAPLVTEKPTEKPSDKATEKSAAKPESKPESKPSGASNAELAKTPDNLPTTNARIVVQVGAFADAAKAREARVKLMRAGLPSYVHVAKTPEGERIRVRLGPFKTKVEADKMAKRALSLGLEANLYWL